MPPLAAGLLPVGILARDPGRLVSQKQLPQEMWGPTHVNESQYLRVCFAQLRRKREDDRADHAGAGGLRGGVIP